MGAFFRFRAGGCFESRVEKANVSPILSISDPCQNQWHTVAVWRAHSMSPDEICIQFRECKRWGGGGGRGSAMGNICAQPNHITTGDA